MKKILVLFIGLMLLLPLGCSNKSNQAAQLRHLQKKMEMAYFEGQRDYANSDIRIAFVYKTPLGEGHWKWIKSPWDGGKKWIFKPSMLKDGR